jgi:hypothetical protein
MRSKVTSLFIERFKENTVLLYRLFASSANLQLISASKAGILEQSTQFVSLGNNIFYSFCAFS